MMATRHMPPNRPPWWPENEPWPPNRPLHWRDWRDRKRPGRLFWRFGCALIALLLLDMLGCGKLVWLISGGPFPAGDRDVWRGISLVILIGGAFGMGMMGRS